MSFSIEVILTKTLKLNLKVQAFESKGRVLATVWDIFEILNPQDQNLSNWAGFKISNYGIFPVFRFWKSRRYTKCRIPKVSKFGDLCLLFFEILQNPKTCVQELKFGIFAIPGFFLSSGYPEKPLLLRESLLPFLRQFFRFSYREKVRGFLPSVGFARVNLESRYLLAHQRSCDKHRPDQHRSVLTLIHKAVGSCLFANFKIHLNIKYISFMFEDLSGIFLPTKNFNSDAVGIGI